MDTSVYTRPNKPAFIKVTDRRGRDIDVKKLEKRQQEQPLAVHCSTECHVTPPSIAQRMAEYLDITESTKILEPHAGTGSLLTALLDNGASAKNITAIERDYALVDHIKGRFSETDMMIKHDCFLEYADFSENKYDRILANPPFKKIKAHMKAALSLLDCNGVLIALVPVTYQHDRAETLEYLDNDTFTTAKVNTKIIQITLT